MGETRTKQAGTTKTGSRESSAMPVPSLPVRAAREQFVSSSVGMSAMCLLGEPAAVAARANVCDVELSRSRPAAQDVGL